METKLIAAKPANTVFTVVNAHGVTTEVMWKGNNLYIAKGGLGTGRLPITRKLSDADIQRQFGLRLA